MKRTALLSLLICFSIMGYAQADYMVKARTEVLASQKRLSKVYNQVLSEYAAYPLFIAKMKLAQKEWNKSVEADFVMLFPETGTDLVQGLYGTIYPLCANEFHKKCIDTRIKFLSQWLKSVKRTDLECSGSIHRFDNKY